MLVIRNLDLLSGRICSPPARRSAAPSGSSRRRTGSSRRWRWGCSSAAATRSTPRRPAAFALCVVEPHLCGPAGEVPILFHDAHAGATRVLCGQGVAPAAATIGHFRNLGLDMVPGSGLVAAVVPGAFDAWLTLLRDHGTMELAEILAPAIGYAQNGHPLLAGAARAIADVAETLRTEWQSGAATWLPAGEPPRPGALFRNPLLAATWLRLLDEAGDARQPRGAHRPRPARLEPGIRRRGDRPLRAHRADGCERRAPCRAADRRGHGALAGDLRGSGRRRFPRLGRSARPPPGARVRCCSSRCGCLDAAGIAEADLAGPDFVHLAIEAQKLAFADREAYYGDPDFAEVPLETLLSRDYARDRAGLIAGEASTEIRPGIVEGFAGQVTRGMAQVRIARGEAAGIGIGEPTMMHLAPTLKPGDTVHLDVIDRHGNIVTATPSGGWPQSSPMVPELGFALNTRAQMFWLEPGLPGSLAPGKRPRTTPHAHAGAARGPAGAGLRHARRRPAGPVAARAAAAAHPRRHEAAGGARPAAVPQPALPFLLLSARSHAGRRGDRGELWRGRDRRAAPARPRPARRAPVVGRGASPRPSAMPTASFTPPPRRG
ncbi:MAG: gamma-glutamyltransferase [Sphingomonas sp.]